MCVKTKLTIKSATSSSPPIPGLSGRHVGSAHSSGRPRLRRTSSTGYCPSLVCVADGEWLTCYHTCNTHLCNGGNPDPSYLPVVDLAGEHLGIWTVQQDVLTTGGDPPTPVDSDGERQGSVSVSEEQHALQELEDNTESVQDLREILGGMALLQDVLEMQNEHLPNSPDRNPKVVSENFRGPVLGELGGVRGISNGVSITYAGDSKTQDDNALDTATVRSKSRKNKSINANQLNNKVIENRLKGIRPLLNRALEGRSQGIPNVLNVPRRNFSIRNKNVNAGATEVKDLRNKDVEQIDTELKFLLNRLDRKVFPSKNPHGNKTDKHRTPLKILAEIILHRNNSRFFGIVGSVTGWNYKVKSSILQLKGKDKMSNIAQNPKSIETKIRGRTSQDRNNIFTNRDRIGNYGHKYSTVQKNAMNLYPINPHRPERNDAMYERFPNGGAALSEIVTKGKRDPRLDRIPFPSGETRDPRQTSQIPVSPIIESLLRQAQMNQGSNGMSETGKVNNFLHDNHLATLGNIPIHPDVLNGKRHHNQMNEKGNQIPPGISRESKSRDQSGLFPPSVSTRVPRSRPRPASSMRNPGINQNKRPQTSFDAKKRGVKHTSKRPHSKPHQPSRGTSHEGYSPLKVATNDRQTGFLKVDSSELSPSDSPTSTLRKIETTSLQTEQIKKDNFVKNSRAFSKNVESHLEEISGTNSSLYSESQFLRRNIVRVSKPISWSGDTDFGDGNISGPSISGSTTNGTKIHTRGVSDKTGSAENPRAGRNPAQDSLRGDRFKGNLIESKSNGDRNNKVDSMLSFPRLGANDALKINHRDQFTDEDQTNPYSPFQRPGPTHFDKTYRRGPIPNIFIQSPTSGSTYRPMSAAPQPATFSVSRATRERPKISQGKLSENLKKNLQNKDLKPQFRKSSKFGNGDQQYSGNGNGRRRPMDDGAYFGHVSLSEPSRNTSLSVFVAQKSSGSIFSPTKKPLMRLYRPKHNGKIHEGGESETDEDFDDNDELSQETVEQTIAETYLKQGKNSTEDTNDDMDLVDGTFEERMLDLINAQDAESSVAESTKLVNSHKQDLFIAPKIYITEQTRPGHIALDKTSNSSTADLKYGSEILDIQLQGTTTQRSPLGDFLITDVTGKKDTEESGESPSRKDKWRVQKSRWFTPNMANNATSLGFSDR
ncbi:hypothetical protein EGW08_007550 [Elysia chlorotica]|uniref:Uncharacterized protein n=1 Tax=Elysia chlorotica TaxID=188477 RepID=A0A3S1BIV1_ELYCH|nr:hypothetical protein EGW08_007550 [Elysia chlorotica]